LIKYSGGCTASIDLGYTEKVLEERIRQYLERAGLDQDFNYYVTVSGCDGTTRKRREADVMDIEVILTSEYESAAEERQKTSSIESILNSIKEDIERGFLTLQVSDGDGSREVPNDAGIQVSVGSVDAGSCDAGEIKTTIGCLKCPPGTQQEGAECTLCPSATYQAYEGQTECSDCPSGRTGETDEGRYSELQCVDSPSSSTLPIIIGVVVALLVLIVIIVVVVVICRRKKNDQAHENRPKSLEKGFDVDNKAYTDVYDEIDDNGVSVYERPKNFDKKDGGDYDNLKITA
jgi:hypothetical protein